MTRFAGKILVTVGSGLVRLEQVTQRVKGWDGRKGCMRPLSVKPQGTM